MEAGILYNNNKEKLHTMFYYWIVEKIPFFVIKQNMSQAIIIKQIKRYNKISYQREGLAQVSCIINKFFYRIILLFLSNK